MHSKARIRAYAVMFFSILIGSLFSPIFKTILKIDVGLTSDNITFFRMGMASLVLWAYCLSVPSLRHEVATVLKNRGIFGLLLILGLLRAADLLCWAYALNGTTTFIVSILGNSTPIFVVVASYVLYREKTTPRALLGLAICLVGLSIVGISGSKSGGASLKTILLMISSASVYTGFLLISRKLRTGDTKVSAMLMMTIVFTVCVPTGLIPCLISGAPMGPFPFKGWLLLGALVGCSTLISQIAPIWAIRYLNPTSISMLSLLGPVCTALTCYLLLGEVPTITVLIGGAVVLFGLYLYTIVTERRLENKDNNPACLPKPDFDGK